MAAAVFDYHAWAGRYPELASSVGSNLAASYFQEAGLYFDNTDASPVSDVNRRLLLLNMLVSHIAALNAMQNGQAASPLVGHITSASEGSVSVSVELPGLSAAAAWFAQTRYGFSFWQATQGLRNFRYIPGRQPVFDAPGRAIGPYPAGGLPWLR